MYVGSRGSSVSIECGYGLDDRVIEIRKRIFPLASVSRPALGLTQPPVQWVPGVLSQSPEIETSSFDWAHQSRYPSPVT
jgi:hypothetical protein